MSKMRLETSEGILEHNINAEFFCEGVMLKDIEVKGCEYKKDCESYGIPCRVDCKIRDLLNSGEEYFG